MKVRFPALIVVASMSAAFGQPGTPPVIVVEETVVQPAPGEVIAEEVVTETVVQPAPGEVIAEEVVTETTVAPGLRRLDPELARRQLRIVPRDLPAHAPGTVVETTETSTRVDVPGMPPRVYNTERSVVIVEGRELPYLTIPVLFVKETADLLDSESRVAIEDTAMAINEILKTEPTAVFDIEGHTSTDGTAEFNLDLSAQRARRIHLELTQRYGVPASALSAHGYGENFPKFPNGAEEQMVLDRRVLVVRVK